MLKKATGISIILMFVLFLFGSVTSGFAAPPDDRASKNKACENASDKGKSKSSDRSVLKKCENGSEDDNDDSDPQDRPADCSDPIYAMMNPLECGPGDVGPVL